MRVRGERECRSCGQRWSYYETGEVACPDCGSAASVGVDDRTLHTDGAPDLDLASARRTAADTGIEGAAEELAADLRRYRRRRGFVRGGELLDLDPTYLATGELRRLVETYARGRSPGPAERRYALDLLDLLDGADRPDERPPPGAVPDAATDVRCLADAAAVRTYRREIRTWLDGGDTPEGRRVLGRAAARAKRVEALQGDVDPAETAAVVDTVRRTAEYLRTADEAALAAAAASLDGAEQPPSE